MADVGRIPGSAASFGLFEALVGRRSRRFGAGMRVPDGPLAYASALDPQPLDELERAVLVFAAAGVTGWNLGMPYTASAPPGAGANYPVRLVGRTAPSAAAIHSSELLVADHTGTWITQTRQPDPALVDRIAGLRSLDDLVAATSALLVPLGSEPLDIPARFMAPHNRWDSLASGSTLLVPVTDMTEQLLTFLAIYTGDRAVIWDPATDSPVGDPTRLLATGRLREGVRRTLASLENRIFQMGTVDGALMAYNGQLALQAMGLGGWIYTGIDTPTLLGARSAEGIPGFGFTFTSRPEWGAPNPVGRAGVFETLAAPFAATPDEAVARFVATKFGPGGTFDPTTGGPYRDNAGVKAAVERHDDDLCAYFASVLEGLVQRYGRYPGTIPTVLTSVYLQAQHIDPDYYATFHGEGALLDTHRGHDATWHG